MSNNSSKTDSLLNIFSYYFYIEKTDRGMKKQGMVMTYREFHFIILIHNGYLMLKFHLSRNLLIVMCDKIKHWWVVFKLIYVMRKFIFFNNHARVVSKLRNYQSCHVYAHFCEVFFGNFWKITFINILIAKFI